MNYRTYADMALHIKQILPKISDADLIVGIPRSGMVPAYMIGAFLNRYVCSLDEFVSGIVYSKGMRSVRDRTVKKVLVVDDSVNDGLAMRRAKERLQGKEKEFELVYMAVYAVEKATSLVDVYADICPQPRFFQWNYMYHPGLLPQACLDIDGVLCVDPTAEENDDGEKYRQFILNARPLFVPNDKVKALVTSRLEKYRSETERWLAENGVKYEKLYMLDLPSREERIRRGAHASFKAEIYKKLKDAHLFIESNPLQAAEIHRLSGKPVICTETDEYSEHSGMENIPVRTVRSCSKTKKTLVRFLCVFVPVKSWRRKLRSLYK